MPAHREHIAVIGLGRFGRALGETLISLGHDVLGVDADERCVQDCALVLPEVVVADATNADALKRLGIADFRSAVVAIGNDVEASILATHTLVSLGLPRVWAKAITATHGAILERVGAHRVVFPERDMGVRVAHTLIGRTIDYLELDESFVLIETTVPREIVGAALSDIKIRSRYGVTVVCRKSPGGAFTYATPETVLRDGDVVVIAGEPERAEAFAELS